AQLVRRPGHLRPCGRLPCARGLPRASADGGSRLLAAAQAVRRERPRPRAGRHVGTALPRARPVADVLLHRLAARAVAARSRYRALCGAVAWPCERRTSLAVDLTLTHFVAARGRLAEASHRVRRQAGVNLAEPQIDLAIREREKTATRAVAL